MRALSRLFRSLGWGSPMTSAEYLREAARILRTSLARREFSYTSTSSLRTTGSKAVDSVSTDGTGDLAIVGRRRP